MTRTQRSRIRRLVAALRSGAYVQAQGQLKDGNAMCCLGVACDIYAKQTKRGQWTFRGFEIIDGPSIKIVLPRMVMEWYGFPANEDGDVELQLAHGIGEKKERRVLATSLNDQYNKRFAFIANAFERTFLRPPKKTRKRTTS